MRKVTKVTRMSIRAGSGLERRACRRFGLRTRRRRDIGKCILSMRFTSNASGVMTGLLHSSKFASGQKKTFTSLRSCRCRDIIGRCMIMPLVLYSFADSFRVPTFRRSWYFLRTDSLWYYEEASVSCPELYPGCNPWQIQAGDKTAARSISASRYSRFIHRRQSNSHESQSVAALPQLSHPTQYTRSTYLPELLAGILASHPLQDLRSTRVFIHETSHLVNIVVDNNVQSFLDATGFLHLVGCELFRHRGPRWADSGTEMWLWVDALGISFGWAATSSVAMLVYSLYLPSLWANVMAVLVLPRIMVVDDERQMEMR